MIDAVALARAGLALLLWLVGAALFVTIRRVTGSFRGRAGVHRVLQVYRVVA